ncbi:innexin unc-9 [Patella vulgata]|uniref:innexin unc-9 n=1 Tax=Patella vulgata TaxID=6465 RepID=UPI002180116F|nr:innexin unc-9 [Patella vulgata]XP_050418129.1 innexin unc-9 [Patella vulgata]
MLKDLLEVLGKLTISKGARDDDGIDQFHHFVSVAIFAALAAAIGMKQYVGDPIHCWVPAHFAGSHSDYAENLCWISRMYNIHMDDPIPVKIEERIENDVGFYRWVPAMFLLMALMFKLPNVLWTEVRTYSGINAQKIVNMADETTLAPPEERKKMISDIAQFIDRWLVSYRIYKYNVFIRARQKVSGIFCFCFGKRHGTFLTGLYLFVKILNCINVISQFFILSSFLDMDFVTYGWEVITHLNNHGSFEDSDMFPRIALCDFQIRQLQNVQRHTLQCVLSINLFVEKMFAVTWFWLFFLSIGSVFNLGKWIYNIAFSSRKERFIQKYLSMLQMDIGDHEKKILNEFINDYLRDDGCFLLRTVCNNTSGVLTYDLLKELWGVFKEQHEKKNENDS